jgi:hypothetical protein
MNRKMKRRLQPRPSTPAEKEIGKFLQALETYPASVAKQPRLTFQEHLCEIIANEGMHSAVWRDSLYAIGKNQRAQGNCG